MQDFYLSYQARKLFSAEIQKMTDCHFLANVMLRQPHVWASRASPGQKWLVLFQNFFKGNFFCFLDHSVGQYFFALFARVINLKKKRSVKLSFIKAF